MMASQEHSDINDPAGVTGEGDGLTLSPRQMRLIDEAMLIEQEEAKAAGALGFMARTLAQVTLPYTDQKDQLYYERTTGQISLAVRGHKKYGVPFGTLPRTVLAWMCTEAVRTKSPELVLGNSARAFMDKIDLAYNGRDLMRLKRQSLALVRSVISIDSTHTDVFEDIKIARKGFVFWSDTDPDQPSLWDSTMTLTEDFYKAVTTRPVPIDMRVYSALSKSRSPLAMDIYTWLVYRMYVLRVSGHKQALVPWAGLQAQFGTDTAQDDQGLRNFKRRFLGRLKEVLEFYPEAKGHVADAGEHLRITPAKLAIRATSGARLSRI